MLLPRLVALSLIAFSAMGAEDLFRAGVRTTEPMTPAEEQLGFDLPEGFSIQLVNSEPAISKPMNMAFDARGRLWVTDTLEYPDPVPVGEGGRDSVKILEDKDGDGFSETVTVFADGLNIPTGIHPFLDYSGSKPVQCCVVWSIPNIWMMRDNDHDGEADERKVLYGPLGFEKDTHGMHSSFTRGRDGWLYVTHGFRNDTTIRGGDGSELSISSGHTYRIRLDGSRVEPHTFGQVNPFGMCLDRWGNLYTADCHSSPIYQLIRGGYYPSFGKPHYGLGYAPEMIQHTHGSTAICGIVVIDEPAWPEEFQGNVLIGNVMTSRINRDTIEWKGSTPIGHEANDLLLASDPWFRPVDLQMGPDGALYVADFYNRIIGHYEVPLDHPGRDRKKGRIWKIRYHWKEGSIAKSLPSTESKDIPDWIVEAESKSLSRRQLANRVMTDYLTSRVDDSDSGGFPPEVLADETVYQSDFPKELRAEFVWFLHHGNLLKEEHIDWWMNDGSSLVRVQVMKVLAETHDWKHVHQQAALKGLADADPRVNRAAAEAVGMAGQGDLAFALLQLMARVDDEDTHLRHAVKIALKQLLDDPSAISLLLSAELESRDSTNVAEICLALNHETAGDFIIQHLKRYRVSPRRLNPLVEKAATLVNGESMDQLVGLIRTHLRGQLDLQIELFKSIDEGTRSRGKKLPSSVTEWGSELVDGLLSTTNLEPDWYAHPVGVATNQRSPWFGQLRKSDDGVEDWFFCSLPPGGEREVGRIRSRPFTSPEMLSFYLAGHDGYPDVPAQKKNRVRLLDARTGEVLRQQFPFRHDIARKVQWDLSDVAGRQVVLEATDGDSGKAYAWLAIGRVEPAVVDIGNWRPADVNERLVAAGGIATILLQENWDDQLTSIAIDSAWAPRVRKTSAWAVARRSKDGVRVLAAVLSGDGGITSRLRDSLLLHAVGKPDGNLVPVVIDEVRRAGLRYSLLELLTFLEDGESALLRWAKSDGFHRIVMNDSEWAKVKRASESLHGILRNLDQKIRASIEPTDERIVKLLEGVWRKGASAGRGEAIFRQNCAVCHKMGGEGALVGPQLDGIGSRGDYRVLEDVLAPSRYLDPGFRAVTWDLKDDSVITGMPRAKQGDSLLVVDTQGKEHTIQSESVVHEFVSDLSLMPSNFGDLMNDEQLRDLLRFLTN